MRMKIKTTRKEVKEYFTTVISVGYCALQRLLAYETPIAYTCGLYGWNADVYAFGNVAIVTGYRPFGTDANYPLCREYEHKAGLLRDLSMTYDERKAKTNELVKEFIEKSINR